MRDKVLEIAVAVNGAQSLEEITRAVMQRVGEVIRSDRFGDALVDETTDTVGFAQIESMLREPQGCPDQLYLTQWETERPAAHNRRLVAYADTLAEAIELPARQRANLRIAALYHDIGRVGMPLDLSEPSPIPSQPLAGESFHSRVIRIGEVLLAVLHQHERFDGTGVPGGLLGEEIPLLARILATVNAFDALVSECSYHDRSAVERAYETLQDEAGFQLDPELVDHFVAAHAHSRPTLISD